MKRFQLTWLLIPMFVLGCSHEPTPVAPAVKNFEIEQYTGRWYEILRMPHSFEENLIKVTAEYRLNPDGSLEVTNRGFNTKEEEWQTAIGKAVAIEGATAHQSAEYKVTFFWPFYGGYYVSWIDKNYRYAMITSDSTEYFWLLSRSAEVPQDVIDLAIAQAHEWGIDSSKLIKVDQSAAIN